ncbi:hypothetical protein [Ferruginibacter albus]|uniref:hypothetical protein n=1 Tax=Ferruginibacter albus TaxID=2875540 RepID=UPI001CC72008|nr:hypothetical protein [Ferruginibacter albus]UAY53142.1 hypothetical protein K9M53_05565 [Ferruginibacter albus]
MNDNGEKIKTIYEDSLIDILRTPGEENDSIRLTYMIIEKRSTSLNKYSIIDFKDSIYSQEGKSTFCLNKTSSSQKQYFINFKSLPYSLKNFEHSTILSFNCTHPLLKSQEEKSISILTSLKMIINGEIIYKTISDKIVKQ